MIRESTGSPDRRVAEKLLKLRLAEAIKVGDPDRMSFNADRVTLADARTALFAEYETKRRRSRSTAEHFVKNLTDYFGETRRVRQIGQVQIAGYITKRRRDGMSDASINRELACLHHMFILLVNDRRLSHDDVPKIAKLDEPESIGKYCSPQQFALLLANLPEYLRLPARFSYLCGWRINAVRELRWERVNVKRDGEGAIAGGDITLEQQYSKNRKAYTIKIAGDMRDIFQAAWNARTDDSPFVFVNSEGEQLGDIRKSWYPACVAAGLQEKDAPVGKRFRFHDLRDCAVTNMLDSGVKALDVKPITGHKTDAMIERYYRRQDASITSALERVSERNRALTDTNVIALAPKRKLRMAS